MPNIKKYAAPLGAFALIITAAAGLTFVNLTHAQNSQNNNNSKGMMQRMHEGINGKVSSVSGSTLTVTGKNNTAYTVDASAATIEKFNGSTKTTIAVSAISVGDNVMVKGTVSGTSVTAKTIIVGTILKANGSMTEGTVSAISGNTITLNNNGTTYTVDASNAELMIVKAAGTSLSSSGITINDSLKVFGTVSGNSITATKIMDGQMNMGKGMGMGMMHKED